MNGKIIGVLISCLSICAAKGETIQFENGIPDGWTSKGNFFWQDGELEGVKRIMAPVKGEATGQNSTLRLPTITNPACDNVAVSLEIYNEKLKNTGNDRLRIVASTNDWKGEFNIGNLIYRYNAAATNEDGSVKTWWMTEPQVAYIPGISDGTVPFKLGIKAIAAGGSSCDIYIKSLSIDYKASATPKNVRFCDSAGEVQNPQPGDFTYLAVDVLGLPEGDVSISSVEIPLTRNGIVTYYGATNIIGSDVWITSNKVASAFDAGESVLVDAVVTYSSANFETLGKDGVEKTDEKTRLSYSVPRKGSVWINEVGCVGGKYFVEISGAVNRTLTSGWKLLLDGDVIKTFLAPFDFSSTTNGVGFHLNEYDFSEVRNGAHTFSLVNSAGICEHSVDVIFPIADGISRGQTGYLPYIEGWDYEDAVSKLSWSNDAAEPSLGSVNKFEGFNVPISGEIGVYAYRMDGEEMLPFPSALVSVTNFFTGEGNETIRKNTDSKGLVSISLTGTHSDAAHFPLKITAEAFGWSSIPTNGTWNSGDRIEMRLDQSVGFETFDTSWPPYLKKEGTVGGVRWSQDAQTGSAVVNMSGAATVERPKATTLTPFFSRGKKVAQYQMKVRHEKYVNAKADRAWATVGANSATWWTTQKLANYVENSKTAYWRSLRTYKEIPDSITERDPLEFSLWGQPAGGSSKSLYVDDIRLSFQDSVEISELTVATNEVNEGQTVAAVSAVVSPLATEAGVKNVSVDFMLKVKDGATVTEFAVPCDWSNAVAVVGGSVYDASGRTNTLFEAMRFTATEKDVSTALAAAGGGKYFGTGAMIEYYVCAHYYADSNDPIKSKEWEKRYYPDNYQTDDSGAWYVIGDYNPVATNMTITGPGLSFRSDPTLRSDGFTFDFRAFSSAGDIVSNGVTVAGVTTTFVAGGKTKVLDSTFTLDGGLTANTSYTVTLIYWTENGQMVTRDMEITTLGTAAAPTLVDRTADSLTVKADGCKAAAMAIACNGSTQWIAYGESATFNGLEPDCEYEVTVVAVRNLAGVETETAAAAKFYTLPNYPTANVTETPGWGSHTISVTNLTNDAFGAFGNPSNTVYAFYVESVNNEGVVVATNWLGETAGGIEEIDEAMPKWLTLAEWNNKVFRLSLATTETNNLYLIAGGREPIPDGHEAANGFELTEASPKRLVKISLFAETVGEAERVAYDPAQHEATYGLVSLTNRVMSPFADGVKDATVAYEYTTDDGATWNEMTLRTTGSIMAGGSDPKISGNEIKDVLSDDCVSNIVTVTWDSAKDLAADSVYTVAIRATLKDGVHTAVIADVSLKGGELDFVKPTVELTSDTRDPFPLAESPMVVKVKFSKPVTGFTKDSLSVGNGTAVVTGADDTYTVSVTPKNDGVVTVQVLADKVVDQFGNKNKASDSLFRTFDTTPPVIHSIEGEPGEMAVTNGTGFAFTAVATDESMPLKYHWATNGFDVAGNATSELTGEDALEGTNVVTVFAEDNAGNLSMKAKRMWVVDTIAPTKPEISGTPAKFTNVPAFSMTAASEDATRLTYHWTFNDADFTGATLTKTAREGANAVRVYATDEAGNVSPTNSYSWTLDTLKPTNLKIDGDPQEGVVTNGTEFAFTASASDATQLTFHWTTNGVPVTDYTAAGLSGTAIEGTNTVSVYAKDVAGNACDPTNRTWVVDTIAPTKPEISGKPAALTNEVSFSMTASSVDATRLTYHWTFNDEDFTGATLAKTAREGVNAARVYATDEAGNVSPTNFWNWVVDTQAPTDPVITGTPAKGSITNVKAYDLTAESTDEHLITYHWTLGARKAAVTNFVGTAEDGDGTYTASVYATDAAGNVSGTTTWTWTLDTTAPTVPVISGTPANGSVTNEPNFSLTGAAKDNLTTITYHWLTNGVAAADVTNLVGRVEEDGLFEVKCYATDAAGNISETNDWSWTFDRTPPTKPVITDNLKKGAITNVEAYDLTAASTDEHLITYHWTLGEKKETVTNFVGSVTSSGEYTDFTAFVYATDEAGNVSETSSISWRLDTKRPMVTLTSTASGHFNKKAAPMEVTATFSEEVTNFTYECVTVQTGTVSNEVKTVEEKRVFRFWVYPEHYGVPSFIDEETVSVSIDANKVWDYAGNGNEASLNEQGEQAPLTRVYDTKSPIVTLSSETPDNFNASFVPLKVTIGVTGKGVTELTQESIVITNGVIAKFEKTDEKQGDDGLITEKTYALEVVPTKEALITVVVPESVLTNMTGNTNPASEPPVRKTYDNTAPQNLAINGEPAQNKVTAATTFDFEATADDLTAMNFHWKLNGVAVTGNETSKYSGTVEKGTNWVTVSATDAAGNTCAEVKRTWVVDFEPPEDLTLSGTPGKMDEIVVTNGTDFAYTASAMDETQISYHWTTNGVEVVNNLSTNLVGVAIEGTNTVSVYATDEADNVSKVTNSVTWVVDTIPPKLGELSGTPKKGEIVATNGFNFATFAEDATGLTYHWTLNGKSVSCTTSNYVGEVTVDGTYTLTVYVTDEAGNVSPTTNSTWWVVDRIAPTVPVLSGVPADGAITNGTGYGYTATSTDEHLKEFWWALDGGAAEVRGLSEKFKGDVAEGFGKHAVTVYAVDEAGNQSVPTNWTWTVDTVSPTNLVVTGIPPAVTNVAAFSMSASALDDTAITYHWLTNGIEMVSTNLVGTASEGTNTVQVWAEDAAHNVSTTNTIRWILDTIAPTKPVVDGTPKPKAITNDKAFSFSATAEDKTALTFFWTVDEQKMTAPAFAGEVDGDGEHTVSVYAADAAGNVSPTNTFSWTLDTIAPDNLVITGTPAYGSATNEPNYSLSATAEDATTLTFHWTLGDKTEAVTNFIGEVEEEGAYEVTCYATDAAGNSSVTNSWRWTFDMTPPTLPVISGTPANGSVTNKPNYNLTAAATDNLTVITYHWMTNGVAAADVTNFVGEVKAEGEYVVSCYATDAANNVSETNVWSWTFDRTPPTALAISGKPEEGEVVATNGFAFAASATDLTDVSYRWTLNGSGVTTGENFIGNAPEGTNTVSVNATDEAGNVSAVSRTWVVDTLPPTNRIVFAVPGEGALTNITFFSITAQADDATQVEYFWTTNAVAVEDATVTTNLTSWLAREGTNTVTVYAKDEAGNVSETNRVTWTVDLTPPTNVVFKTETAKDHVINRTDVFKVTAGFNEPVVGFTKESVTVSNGMVTNVTVSAEAENAYDVWIAPVHDGEITVRIDANKVKDLAGNGNVASEQLTRTCDITPPSVTLSSNIKIDPFGPNDLIGNPFTVTVTFSETVTNFTASSVTVSNCTVKSVSPLMGAAKTYTVVIEPPDHDDVIAISIAGGAVKDLAGNGNTASDVLTRKYDMTGPKNLKISGTPKDDPEGLQPTSDSVFNLTCSSEDFTTVIYRWRIDNGPWQIVTNFTGHVEKEGSHTVEVWASDLVGNPPAYATRSWTYKSGVTPEGVSFGDSVQLKITDVSVTNVEFTAVDFQPGEESTFALREFELKGSQATKATIEDLKMRLIVGTNVLDYVQKRTWPVKVDENADFDAGTLTVTIPGKKTTDQNTGKPFETFFIFGIDNKGSDE